VCTVKLVLFSVLTFIGSRARNEVIVTALVVAPNNCSYQLACYSAGTLHLTSHDLMPCDARLAWRPSIREPSALLLLLPSLALDPRI
jgi:hypothetical protein